MDFGEFSLVEKEHINRPEAPLEDVYTATVETKHGSKIHRQLMKHWKKKDRFFYLKSIRKKSKNGTHFLEILLCTVLDFAEFQATEELSEMLLSTNAEIAIQQVSSLFLFLFFSFAKKNFLNIHLEHASYELFDFP